MVNLTLLHNRDNEPTSAQIALINQVYFDIQRLIQLPPNQLGGVIAISGLPGTGKTTSIIPLLNLFHRNKDLTYTLIGTKDLNKASLNFSNIEERVVVFDDVNFNLMNETTKELIESIFTTDYPFQLTNKYGEPLIMILISNEKNFTVYNPTINNDNLPKINSGISHRMKLHNMDEYSEQNFRKHADKRGDFVSSINDIPIKCEEHLVCEIDMMSLIEKMKVTARNKDFEENIRLVKELLDKARQSKIIIFQYGELKDDFNLLTRLAFPILDLMEDSNGDVTVYFANKTPKEAINFLINEINENDSLSLVEKSKYLSRLNRLW